MQEILTSNVLFLIDLLDGKARVVGGAVRDALNGERVHDIDLATELLPDVVVDRLTVANVRIMTAGIGHGTVMAIIDKTPYEITTLRQDTQTDGRHAQVVFTSSYEQDANRRDFTVNALYMDKNGQIYDYVGGQKDLKDRLVRFIGCPADRVQEDFLRILRYFRFWGKLGAGVIHQESLEACSQYAKGLQEISHERKREELFRILMMDNCDQVLSLMQQSGVLSYVLPKANIPALTAFLKVCPMADIPERLAVLTYFEQKLPSLLLSKTLNKLLTAFKQQIELTTDMVTERLRVYHLGERVYRFHVYKALADHHISKKMANKLLSITRPIFPIQGKDFLRLGYPAGVHIKQYLQQTERLWAENGFSDDKELVLNLFLVYNKKKE